MLPLSRYYPPVRNVQVVPQNSRITMFVSHLLPGNMLNILA